MLEEFPKEIVKLANDHKVKWKSYDTFYNLCYDLAKFDSNIAGNSLEKFPDFNIQEFLREFH